MSRFRYKAAQANGTVIDGTLDATDRDHAIRQLREFDRIPIRVEAETTNSTRSQRGTSPRQRRISEQRIADMTRELATLLHAGMPLDRCLGTLAELAAGEPLGKMLEDIRARVKEGENLSAAMERHSPFGRFYVNLLKAGEIGGSMELVLERLADHLDRSIEIKSALKSALVYPIVLIVVALVSMYVLLGFVVPRFTEMFDSVGQVLPLSTRITIAVGEFLQQRGWLLIVLLILAGIWVWRQLREERTAYRWHALVLRVPVLGPLLLKIEAARFARTLGTLLQNGVPLLDALGIVRQTVGNLVLADGLGRVTDSLRRGQKFAGPLGRETPLPRLAVQMISVGEESGSLPETLDRVGRSFDRESKVAIDRALSLLEPMLILVLGLVIGAVIMSMLVAILGVNDLVM